MSLDNWQDTSFFNEQKKRTHETSKNRKKIVSHHYWDESCELKIIHRKCTKKRKSNHYSNVHFCPVLPSIPNVSRWFPKEGCDTAGPPTYQSVSSSSSAGYNDVPSLHAPTTKGALPWPESTSCEDFHKSFRVPASIHEPYDIASRSYLGTCSDDNSGSVLRCVHRWWVTPKLCQTKSGG